MFTCGSRKHDPDSVPNSVNQPKRQNELPTQPRPSLHSRRQSSFAAKPDPVSAPELADRRSRQWRQSSCDPFELISEKASLDSESVQSEDAKAETLDSDTRPKQLRWTSGGTEASSKFVQSPQHEISEFVPDPDPSKIKSSKPDSPKPEAPELKYPGPKWVHLFYDLAWTASFASLNQNGKFDGPLDLLNYFLFFAAVMWLWASQTLYSIHFYTNDWFHLTSTFLQLFVFGMLAATTIGYDVTTYITHSPGIDKLDPSEIGQDPKSFADEKTAHSSAVMIAVAFAATRFLHCLQYLRVCFYARRPSTGSSSSSSIHPQIKAVTAGLLISTPIFFAAVGITKTAFGEEVAGASLKLGFWLGGFIIEVVSHLIVPFWDRIAKVSFIESRLTGRTKRNLEAGNSSETDAKGVERSSRKELPVSPGMDLCERLQTITTVILGEGINGIAGTLSAVMLAPEIGKVVGINIFCTACTIWFIAYIYFEGVKGDKAPDKKSLRYIVWLVLHLPFLAATVFLLIGIKGQFLLTSFLSTLFGTNEGFNRIMREKLLGNPSRTAWRTNPDMTQFLLERGIVWADEFNNLTYAQGNITQTHRNSSTVMAVWIQRLSLTIAVNAFKNFNKGDDSISGNVQSMIDGYYADQNFTQVAEDIQKTATDPAGTIYYQIMEGLLEGPLRSTRYIIAFAGLILLSLSLQDLVHSKQLDRYQWGVIITRFLMGTILCLLLLLNLGKYQELFVPVAERHQRAGVFQWLEAFWVLPTIAIAYGIEFCAETLWAWAAQAATVKVSGEKTVEVAKKIAEAAKKRAEEARRQAEEAHKQAEEAQRQAEEAEKAAKEKKSETDRTSGGPMKLSASPRQSLFQEARNEGLTSAGSKGITSSPQESPLPLNGE